MTSKSASLLTIRGLDASKAYSTIQDELAAINDAIKAGNQDDRDLPDNVRSVVCHLAPVIRGIGERRFY